MFPDVVSLPCGTSFAPFYIQAPNWHRLLKIMTGLHGTRIEPSPQAGVDKKYELKLRTVVQFVRVRI